ncbi:MAG: hypothetical protein FWF57_01860 [Defluviitaleaceae bacterium]|nr:hypothetical protein [Defluviitaleaceae bacterium]
MTNREKILVSAGLIFAIVFLWNMFFLSPTLANINNLQNEIETLESNIEMARIRQINHTVLLQRLNELENIWSAKPSILDEFEITYMLKRIQEFFYPNHIALDVIFLEPEYLGFDLLKHRISISFTSRIVTERNGYERWDILRLINSLSEEYEDHRIVHYDITKTSPVDFGVTLYIDFLTSNYDTSINNIY